MTEIKKADLKSKDIKLENINKLKQLFPEIVSEGKIDFDKLKLTLGDEVDLKKERYGMSWAGKYNCFKIIQDRSTGTLKPVREESVDFDTTQNLFIEGDNLEVLKLLQKSYYEKVKMIYIDPPYNTGKDFVYSDKFGQQLNEYLKLTNQLDSDGKKLSTNTDTDGRYHSNWMNMMYPRLYLARNLLKDDGVIFISIDDHEVDNLKKICDDIFGEENFLTKFVWIYTGKEIDLFDSNSIKTLGTNLGTIKKSHEYILCYKKSNFNFNLISNDKKYIVDRVTKKGNLISTFKFPKGLKNKNNLLTKTFKGVIGGSSEPIKIINKEGMIFEKGVLKNDVVLETCYAVKGYLDSFFNNKEVFDRRGEKILDIIFSNTGIPQIVKEKSGYVPSTILSGFGDTSNSEKELITLFDNLDIFDYPKPTKLLKKLILLAIKDEGIILDFFAGSGTTAHAVLDLNKEDKGNRKFICVQLPEKTDDNSIAFKEGYKTISDIAKERIRRVINKIKEEKTDNLDNFDLGFKVFKLDKSNFKQWDTNGEKVQTAITDHIDQIKKEANKEDVLYEILLKDGIKLTTNIIKIKIDDKEVYSIENNFLLVCLEDKLTLDLFKKMKELNSKIVIVQDKGFNDNDQLKTNAVELMTYVDKDTDKKEHLLKTI